jgi:hypothetical protein
MSGEPRAFEQHRELFAQALPAPWPHQGSAAELADWIVETIESNALFPAAEARCKRLPQLLIFVSRCAPPGASVDGLRLACGFLFAFFLFNDDFATHGAAFDESASTPASSGVLYVRNWRRAFAERFGGRSARFLSAFERYRRSLAHEQRLKERPHPPTFEEYVDRERGRYQWVATAPYIELWEVVQGIGLEERERAQADQLQVLGVELTYIANDVGSLRRDEPAMSYITLRAARDLGRVSLSARLEATRADYDARVQAFLDRARELRGELSRYASLVSAITDGNLEATLLLARAGDAGRYAAEAGECLSQLRRLGRG